jgi:hypothetical protein
MRQWFNDRRDDESGVTLVELVVVMTLAMLISGMVVVALSTSARIARSSLTRTQAQESARALIDGVTSELRDAQPAQVCVTQDAQTGCRRIIDYPGVPVDSSSSPEAQQGLLPPAVLLDARADRLAFPIAASSDTSIETVQLPDVRVLRVMDNNGVNELWSFRIVQTATGLTDPAGSAPSLYASIGDSVYTQEVASGPSTPLLGTYIADLPSNQTDVFSYFRNDLEDAVPSVVVSESPLVTAVRVQVTLTFRTRSSRDEKRVESVDTTVALRAGNYVRQRNADRTASL